MGHEWDMSGLELLGADPAMPARPSTAPPAFAIAFAAGAAGALLCPSHRVLAALGASALASNAHALATGKRTWRQAATRLGRHAVATTGSLLLPSAPVLGYVAGAVVADLFLGDRDGFAEEWARYAGAVEAEPATAARQIAAESTVRQAT